MHWLAGHGKDPNYGHSVPGSRSGDINVGGPCFCLRIIMYIYSFPCDSAKPFRSGCKFQPGPHVIMLRLSVSLGRYGGCVGHGISGHGNGVLPRPVCSQSLHHYTDRAIVVGTFVTVPTQSPLMGWGTAKSGKSTQTNA
jgi:hypothetical protein